MKSRATQKELKEFWKYKINPITGFYISPQDKYSTNHRQELAKKRILEEKSNQE